MQHTATRKASSTAIYVVAKTRSIKSVSGACLDLILFGSDSSCVYVSDGVFLPLYSQEVSMSVVLLLLDQCQDFF